MSRFISTRTHRVELGEGEWVDLKENLPYYAIDQVVSSFSQSEAMKSSVDLLNQAIVGWNLLGEKSDEFPNGEPMPFSIEKIKDLDSKTIVQLSEVAMSLYLPSKKN